MDAKNPKRVAAGARNRALRGPLTEQGRARLQKAAFQHRPWEHTTGPKTVAGKAQAIQNGKRRQLGRWSVREIRARLAPIRELVQQIREIRRKVLT